MRNTAAPMTEIVAPIARKVCDIRSARVTARNALACVLGVLSMSAVAAPGCGPWEPARDPYRGDQAEAVMRLVEIPEIERRQLADMVRQRYGWRRVMVGRDSIDGGRLGELRSMNFGAGRICAGPVDRSTWPAGRHESGLAFTVGRWSVIPFDSCRNVALASETMALLPPRPYTPAEIRAGQRGGLGALGLPSMSVPEPSTWPLVAVALAGVVAMRRGRK